MVSLSLARQRVLVHNRVMSIRHELLGLGIAVEPHCVDAVIAFLELEEFTSLADLRGGSHAPSSVVLCVALP